METPKTGKHVLAVVSLSLGLLTEKIEMIKFFVGLERGNLIGMGFSEGNFEQLKLKRPIHFRFSDMGVDLPGGIVIVYPDPENDALEKRLPPNYFMIEINDDAMKFMKSGKPWDVELSPKLRACMIWGMTEDDIRDLQEQVGGWEP